MMAETNKENILALENVGVNYGEAPVLRRLNMSVGKGEIVTLLGPNGSGKSTLMRTIVGMMPVLEGKVLFEGTPINGLKTEKIIRMGLTLVPEGKLLFSVMSVRDNLILGAYHRRGPGSKEDIKNSIDTVMNLFPTLKGRKKQLAETLSGGEQEMVAIGRGLMSSPKLLMLDEPSFGLAPIVINEVVNTLARLRNELGVSILLAEQNVAAALRVANRGYVLSQGQVVFQGSAEELRESDIVKLAYLGKAVPKKIVSV